MSEPATINGVDACGEYRNQSTKASYMTHNLTTVGRFCTQQRAHL